MPDCYGCDPRAIVAIVLAIEMLIYVTNTSVRIRRIGRALPRRGPLTVETWAFYTVSQQK